LHILSTSMIAKAKARKQHPVEEIKTSSNYKKILLQILIRSEHQGYDLFYI
jgi:hypothetical protein